MRSILAGVEVTVRLAREAECLWKVIGSYGFARSDRQSLAYALLKF